MRPGQARHKCLLTANYSDSLLELLTTDPALLDAVKVTDFDDPGLIAVYQGLRSQKVVFLHGLAQPALPGNPDFRAAFRPEALLRALAATDTRYLSVHLESRVAYADPDPGAARFLEALSADVAMLSALTGLPVHLENTHWYWRVPPGKQRRPAFQAEPAFISEALSRTGARLLLDLTHAQVAAWHRGQPVLDYLGELPLDLVEELHISGPAVVEGELRDRHEEVGEAGYDMLAWVLDRVPARVITLEYGGVGPVYAARSDRDILLRQLHRLRLMASNSATNW